MSLIIYDGDNLCFIATRYMQKIEALHAAVAQGSLREVQAMLGRAKLALSKVDIRQHKTLDNIRH